jgi:uncharacterized membrane protein
MPDFREADFAIWQFLVVVIHVFSAIIWIGGSIFLTLVMVPVARGMEPSAMGFLLLWRAALRFSGIVWVLLALLAISGALALYGRGIGFDRFGEDGFWSTEIGVVLLVKLVLVGLMLVISGYHDFAFGPKISELMRLVPRGERPPDSTVAVLGLMLVRGVPG